MTRLSLLAALALVASGGLRPPLAEAKEQPNIVFILADDLGFGVLIFF